MATHAATVSEVSVPQLTDEDRKILKNMALVIGTLCVVAGVLIVVSSMVGGNLV